MTQTTPSVQLTLGFFEDFLTVTGLLRDTGARRTDSRVFVLDQTMSPAQVVALVQLLEFDRRWGSQAFTVQPTPRLPTTPYSTMRTELTAWWGTVGEKPWLT
ncbi:hypothetical protein ACF05T_28360 [Streptomyces lateritius]|uniref:Uncharacterized protein n=1 Tax=Streptomyces lateritius TaxID=67313 RepID=A0ABW6YKM3_9ACTN